MGLYWEAAFQSGADFIISATMHAGEAFGIVGSKNVGSVLHSTENPVLLFPLLIQMGFTGDLELKEFYSTSLLQYFGKWWCQQLEQEDKSNISAYTHSLNSLPFPDTLCESELLNLF